MHVFALIMSLIAVFNLIAPIPFVASDTLASYNRIGMNDEATDFVDHLVKYYNSSTDQSDSEINDYHYVSRRKLLSGSHDSVSMNNSMKLNRRRREGETCKLPKERRDSTLMCVSYPKYVQCKQICIFGHTLREGIQKDYKCIHEENMWIPDMELEQCLPFIDCTLRIVGSGYYACSPSKRGPTCKVACNHYEDKPPVSEASYTCDINGKWSPDLPHCVKPASGKTLVPPPKGIKYLR